MDGSRFDEFTRTVATSRRNALRLLLGASIAALLPFERGAAAQFGVRPFRRVGKRCDNGQPCGFLAPCRNGVCTPSVCLIDDQILPTRRFQPGQSLPVLHPNRRRLANLARHCWRRGSLRVRRRASLPIGRRRLPERRMHPQSLAGRQRMRRRRHLLQRGLLRGRQLLLHRWPEHQRRYAPNARRVPDLQYRPEHHGMDRAGRQRRLRRRVRPGLLQRRMLLTDRMLQRSRLRGMRAALPYRRRRCRCGHRASGQ